jgi:hypothetical protein
MISRGPKDTAKKSAAEPPPGRLKQSKQNGKRHEMGLMQAMPTVAA